jgi:hypothetical protein
MKTQMAVVKELVGDIRAPVLRLLVSNHLRIIAAHADVARRYTVRTKVLAMG